LPYFGDVQRFLLFAAPPRSGHSVVGHLLSAHPKVLISDELGAISYFREGYSASQVYALIKHQDWRLHQRKRQKSGYDYTVKGGWQGVYEKYPQVIGDAKGARSITILGEDPKFLESVRSAVGVPLRVLFHLRNPYDIVATKVRKRGITLDWAVTAMENQSRHMRALSSALDPDEYLLQYHEDMVKEPRLHFERMFDFIGVKRRPDITQACADKIWGEVNVTRNRIAWDEESLDRMRRVIDQEPLFLRYTAEGLERISSQGMGPVKPSLPKRLRRYLPNWSG